MKIGCNFRDLSFSAQLDGVTKKAIKRLADHHNINDWLELSDQPNSGERDKNGKRRVRIIMYL